MTLSSLARADAAFHEQIHRQWRDWYGYLKSHLTLLDARHHQDRYIFERAESREGDTTHAEQQLAILPAAERSLFDALVEERRQQLALATEQSAPGRLPDPDAIDHSTLTALCAEADGTATGTGRTPGWGDVPLLIEGQVQWYRVHVAALQEAPAAAYAVGEHDANDIRRRIMVAGLVSVGLVVFLVAWFLWPRSAKIQQATGTFPRPVGNGVATDPWSIRSAIATTPKGDLPISIAPTSASTWSIGTPSHGEWRATAYAPLRLCLPNAVVADATRLVLSGDGHNPDRIYQLSDTASADLIVESCSNAQTHIFGHLEAMEPATLYQPGRSVPLDEATAITVTEITLTSASNDPALPADQARITVTISAPALDWPSLVPTLTLADGTINQTPVQEATNEGVKLHYVVPAPSITMDVLWSVSWPNTGINYQWRSTLAAPQERLQALAVENIGVQQGMLHLELRNQGHVPLQITPNDIILTQDHNRLISPATTDLSVPLAPQEQRSVVMPLPDVGNTPIELSIGTARYEITASH